MKKIFYLFIVLINSVLVYSQTDYKIAFNEKINLGSVDENTEFYIYIKDYEIHLKGNKINDFVFEKPGNVKITVVNPHKHNGHDCTIVELPDEIFVEVSPFKVAFDPTTISFSEPILKNKDTQGVILYIDVNVQTFNNKPAEMSTSVVKSAGIGTKITAILDNKFKLLTKGKHTISYKLSGIVTENSYLMFDFVLPNGNIQFVSLLKPIENQ